MGTVYLAYDCILKRHVALKLLHDQAFAARFQDEREIHAIFAHPSIVPIYDAGTAPEGPYLVMGLIRGETLRQVLDRKALTDVRGLELLTAIAGALDAVHAAGYVHRDVKPQNIIIDNEGTPFLADFGLAKPVGPPGPRVQGLTGVGTFVGTADYVAPEQIRGCGCATASDVYSLTSVLYECLTGIVPFPKSSDLAVWVAHLEESPPLVTDVRPELPRALNAVIARGMAKRGEQRYPSAGALMADAVRAIGSGQSTHDRIRRALRRGGDRYTVK